MDYLYYTTFILIFLFAVGVAGLWPPKVKYQAQALEPSPGDLISCQVAYIAKKIAMLQYGDSDAEIKEAIRHLDMFFHDDPQIFEEIEQLENELQIQKNWLSVQYWFERKNTSA